MGFGRQALRWLLVVVAAAAIAAGCGGAKRAGKPRETAASTPVPHVAVKPPNVVGQRVATAVARLGHRRYRLSRPEDDGRPPPRNWVVCFERTRHDAHGPVAQLIATPACPFLTPRFVGTTVQKADDALYELGVQDDLDTAAPNTTKDDVAGNWTVCTQDPEPGKPIGLDPDLPFSAEVSLAAAPRCPR